MDPHPSLTTDCGGRYTKPRMACLAGYYDPPSIFSAMSFDLRQLPLVSSRIVTLGTRKLELWATNSLQFPFFPGAVRLNYRPVAPATLIAERRYGGHYGKFDCTQAPQYFLRADAMHWPFIRRASAVNSGDAAYAAFAPLTLFWSAESKHNPSPRGFLLPTFIAQLGDLGRSLEARMLKFRRRVDVRDWDRRPSATMGSATGRLLSIRTWDDAVDHGVALQRVLREMEAWVCWAEEVERQKALSLDALRSMDMMFAQEEYVGVWVNGADERTTLSYMAAGVPCFIIHEYAPGVVSRDEVRDVRVFKDFVTGTELEEGLSDANPYQHLARLQSLRDAPLSGDDGRGRARLATAADEARSSSLYLESLQRPELLHPRRLGYSRPNLPSSRAPSMAAPEVNPDDVRQSSSSSTRALSIAAPGPPPRFSGTAPAARKADQDRYAPRPIERVTVAADREDWLVPPPLPPSWAGQWTKWELSEWAGVTAWVGRGKKVEIEVEAVWYDRELGRRLYIDDFVPPRGSIDFQRFGTPVPRFPFYFDNGGSGVAHRASTWMYPKQDSAKHEVGRKQPRPDARRLPFKEDKKPAPIKREDSGSEGDDSGDSDSDNEDGPGTGRGAAMDKGKGKAPDVDAMEIDAEDDRASNVVALRGVDPQVTALMFRAFVADTLYAVRASPLAIVHGQGRLWLRFESISEARRAFGALGQMNAEVLGTFEPDGAFDDAFTYSRDRWTITTMGLDDLPEEMDVDPMPSTPAERLEAAPASNTPGPVERPAAAPSTPSLPVADRTVSPTTSRAPVFSTPPATVERSSAAPLPSSTRVVERSVAAPILPSPRAPVERSIAAPALAIPQGPPRALPPSPTTASRAPPTAPRSMRATTNAFRRLSLAERLETPPPSEPTASSSRSAPRVPRPPRHRPRLEQRLSDGYLPLAQRLSDPPYPKYKKVRRGRRAGRQTKEQEAMRANQDAEETTDAPESASDAILEESDDLEPGEVDEDDDMDTEAGPS
ncbi:hypothetical protein B0H15DRAFT_943066 [Mycena belliarum]|uniref:Uncharacterized protein n=1 Tax=Mycena belliarum TaxID=1033014 RepID=A0AAD6XUK8_9AGAR|nr:hypothetical protein B0H15DRAFT_943066 [Mycena belliae]